MFNSTPDAYENSDTFPLSYEEDHFDSSSIIFNRSYDDDFLSSNLNDTGRSSPLLFSNPLAYILSIIVFYLILTTILLLFSFYQQRQNELDNFSFEDTEEEENKRSLIWKRLLIERMQKGDMQPLLTEHNDQQTNPRTFPLDIV